jgi:hypothetical protein
MISQARKYYTQVLSTFLQSWPSLELHMVV